MTGNNHKLDLVNVDVHTKFGLILSICSQDIEPKRNSDVNIGPSKGNNSCANLGKLTCIYTQVDIVNIDAYAKFDLSRKTCSQVMSGYRIMDGITEYWNNGRTE